LNLTRREDLPCRFVTCDEDNTGRMRIGELDRNPDLTDTVRRHLARVDQQLELARRWRALIEQFTGGDDGIRESLATIYRQEGARSASRGMVDPELMAYVRKSLAALS
jgi:hypothetical protein